MGRNTVPEVKPPAPSPERATCRKEITPPHTAPLPPPQALSVPRAPSPLSSSHSVGGRVGALRHAGHRVPAPDAEGAGKGAGSEGGEEETEGGEGEEPKPTQVRSVRHDVTGRRLYIRAPGRHLGLSGLEVAVGRCDFSVLRLLNRFSARGCQVLAVQIALNCPAFVAQSQAFAWRAR